MPSNVRVYQVLQRTSRLWTSPVQRSVDLVVGLDRYD